MRIFEMKNPDIKANIMDKMYDPEGHLPAGVEALKKLQRGDLKVSVPILLPKFRLSYPTLVEPKEGTYMGKKLEASYQATMIFGPESIKGLYPFWRTSYALALKYLGKHAQPFLLGVNTGANLIKSNEDHIAERMAKGKDVDGLDRIYVPGGAFFSASKSAKSGPVMLVGKDRQVMDKETAKRELYAGCYCQATIELFAMEGKLAKRLVAIMKVGEGDRISGGLAASVDHFATVNVMDDPFPGMDIVGATGAGTPTTPPVSDDGGSLFG